jgi:diketogulonate reductase-like aldo/keto reductase
MSERPQRPTAIGRSVLPPVLSGTAWKEDETEPLTQLALDAGFRGIDTANQRRHYREAAVGKAVSAAIARGIVTRDQLFLQTKFTFRRAQDHRLPYDPHAPIPIQVEQSCAGSLDHLGVDTVDSYLLHGPIQRVGLTSDDWAAWRAMEALQAGGRVRFLGISNVSLEQLQSLCDDARITPRFVQNRCYASQGWDRRIREFCNANILIYQGFSLLTANRDILIRPELARIAARYGWTTSQLIFRFALDIGMLPLTGTTSATHMREDLAVLDSHQLEPSEIQRIETIGARA